MENKVKVRLTKEQVEEIVRKADSINFVGAPVIMVDTSQVVTDMANLEKWKSVIAKVIWGDPGMEFHAEELADILDRTGCDADAAYKEVIENE